MSYYFTKTLNMSFDKAIAGVTEELKNEMEHPTSASYATLLSFDQ